MKIKKIMLVVDCQYDFISPSGSLYVDGALQAASKISDKMKEMDAILFTVDWHPSNHCSFRENGGQWNKHCIMYSKDAAIPDYVLEGANGKPTLFIEKGTLADVEEYGAFENPDNMWKLYKWMDANFGGDDLLELYVCGVAGDYCVINTVKSLMEYEYGRNKRFSSINLLQDLCPCIDKKFDMVEACGKLGVNCISSDELTEQITTEK